MRIKNNIVIAVIIGTSLIISASIIKQDSDHSRYKIIMNEGSEAAGLLTIKYDTVTGRAWGLNMPEKHWAEIKDYGYFYTKPQKDSFIPDKEQQGDK